VQQRRPLGGGLRSCCAQTGCSSNQKRCTPTEGLKAHATVWQASEPKLARRAPRSRLRLSRKLACVSSIGRRSPPPGDYLLSLIAADTDLQLDDIVVTAILTAVAGHQTTANLLGAAIVRQLTRRPDGSRPLMAAQAISSQ
jgi:cytochrome P450